MAVIENPYIGDLVRFEDDLSMYYGHTPSIRFGVCGRYLSTSVIYIYRIRHPNPPYGMKATDPIKVQIKKIKKNFGAIDYNEFMRNHPEWII